MNIIRYIFTSGIVVIRNNNNILLVKVCIQNSQCFVVNLLIIMSYLYIGLSSSVVSLDWMSVCGSIIDVF